MVAFATALAARGLRTATFDFLYMEEKRRVPDRKPTLEACWRAAIAGIPRGPDALAIGGKSMGGRIASQVAAAGVDGLMGLVFLGYPLHPPGRPEQLRSAHLSQVAAPMLFVQGSRDPFGTPAELAPILQPMEAATLHAIEGGDHSLKVRKRDGDPAAVLAAVQDTIVAWLYELRLRNRPNALV